MGSFDLLAKKRAIAFPWRRAVAAALGPKKFSRSLPMPGRRGPRDHRPRGFAALQHLGATNAMATLCPAGQRRADALSAQPDEAIACRSRAHPAEKTDARVPKTTSRARSRTQCHARSAVRQALLMPGGLLFAIYGAGAEAESPARAQHHVHDLGALLQRGRASRASRSRWGKVRASV